MPFLVKSFLRSLVVDLPIVRQYRKKSEDKELNSWVAAGKQDNPPHVVKQRILLAYRSAFSVETLIETGTFRGDMVDAMRDHFHAIYSIELSPGLFRLAQQRFHRDGRVHILHGDSEEVLPGLLAGLSGSSLFWLDGHYSAGETAMGKSETPIMGEICAILEDRCKHHVILVDNARCFDGSRGYPSLEHLKSEVIVRRQDYEFHVANDVIRIHPGRSVPSDF